MQLIEASGPRHEQLHLLLRPAKAVVSSLPSPLPKAEGSLHSRWTSNGTSEMRLATSTALRSGR